MPAFLISALLSCTSAGTARPSRSAHRRLMSGPRDKCFGVCLRRDRDEKDVAGREDHVAVWDKCAGIADDESDARAVGQP